MLSDDIRKVLMAGVGAISTAVEKSAEFVGDIAKKNEDMPEKCKAAMDELAKKGEAAFEQGKAFGNELKTKVKDALDNASLGADMVMNSLGEMSDEELDALKLRVEEMQAERQMEKSSQEAQPAEGESAQPQGEGCCCCQPEEQQGGDSEKQE